MCYRLICHLNIDARCGIKPRLVGATIQVETARIRVEPDRPDIAKEVHNDHRENQKRIVKSARVDIREKRKKSNSGSRTSELQKKFKSERTKLFGRDGDD